MLSFLPTRIASRYAIRDSGIFHKMWRGHNREHVLASRTDKLSYLNDLRITLAAANTPFVADTVLSSPP